MPRSADPFNDEDLFDSFELGDTRSPGVIKSMSGHERKINWDVKEGQGQSGASSTLKSVPLRTPSVTIFLADEVERADVEAFRAVCYSTINGAKPKALDVYHPDWSSVGIRSVTLASFGPPVYDGKGGEAYTIVLQEYSPPKPKGGSATGSKGGPKPDPNAAANAELAALTKQYAATPWG